MVDLEFVDQHNMVVCLEKTGGNSEFHKIVDFLTSSLIHHALTAVVVTEASIRGSLLFNDVVRTACLTNEAIFQNLALMGYEVPTGRYVVPTGRVIATDSVIVATSGYVVPAAYDISPGRVK
ncbi:hypothetical protein Tco_0174058 [Tanacetum coccineum]